MDLARLNLEDGLLGRHLGEEAKVGLGERHAAAAVHRAMRVEVLLKVGCSRHSHVLLQPVEVVAVRHDAEFQLVGNLAAWRLSLHHVVAIVNLDQIVDHVGVVGHVSVSQLVNLVENLVHFLHVLGGAHPELALRVAQALRLDLLDLHNGEIALLTPLKLLIEEVEHREVKTPHVITAGQVDIIVRIETREADRATEVSILALWHWLVLAVEMLLGEAEVDDVDLGVLAVKHKVRSLDVTVDETTLVHLFDSDDHLDQNLDGYLQVVALLEAAACLGEVDAEEVHHDEVLLHVLDVLVRVWHMLQS